MQVKCFGDSGPRELLVTGIFDYEILPGDLVRLYVGMHRGRSLNLDGTLLIPASILTALAAKCANIATEAFRTPAMEEIVVAPIKKGH